MEIRTRGLEPIGLIGFGASRDKSPASLVSPGPPKEIARALRGFRGLVRRGVSFEFGFQASAWSAWVTLHPRALGLRFPEIPLSNLTIDARSTKNSSRKVVTIRIVTVSVMTEVRVRRYNKATKLTKPWNPASTRPRSDCPCRIPSFGKTLRNSSGNLWSITPVATRNKLH